MLPVNSRATQRLKGFTLIELVVAVTIIGILAAIAIPSFSSMRERAWQAELVSGVRNVAMEIESAAVDEGGDYMTLTNGILRGGLQDMADGLLGDPPLTFTAVAVSSSEFCIKAEHARLVAAGVDATVTYSSGSGGLGTVGETCPVPQRLTRPGRRRR